MFNTEFDQLIRENFDLSDTYTRKYIAVLEDGDKENLISALSSALYDKIVNKVDKIDFGTIPMSRGDITKVQGFDKTEECLAIMKRLVAEYEQPTDVIDVVINAINNVRDRKALFMKGFTLNNELPMLIYNLAVLSIERSVSFMIATCVQFIKDPNSNTTKQALDKVAYRKTMDDVLYQQLASFNNLCNKKVIDTVLENSMKHPIKESIETAYNFDNGVGDENSNSGEVCMDCDPFDPDDTTEPFGMSNSPSSSVADDDNTIPSSEDFPEDRHDDNGNLIGDDEELDIDIEDDNVEPDNIPTVLPGDDVSDTPITEDEINENASNKVLSAVGNAFAKGFERVKNGDITKIEKTIGGVAVAALSTTLIAKYGVKIISLLINFLRLAIYQFYYSKLKFSDYLEVQATLIESNANELENSTDTTLSDAKRKKVVDKQRKTAEKLRNWANKLAIDNKKSANDAKKAAEEDSKERKKVSKNEDGDDVLF